jgi:Tol biopolymer transport system component
MNDMQRDLDELGRRLWPRTDALRPAPSMLDALGRTHRPRGKMLNLLAAVAVVAVVAVILAVPIVLGRLESRHATPAALPRPSANVSPRPPLHHNGQIVMGIGNSLIAIDPATGHQKIIFSSVPGDSSDEIASPAWSPDGTKLAYLRSAELWVLDTTTGQTRQLTTCHGCNQYDYMSWSPDSSRLVFSEPDQFGSLQLYIIDADGSHTTQLTHFPAALNAMQPTWSPDGTHIAFTFFSVANVPNQGGVFGAGGIDVIRPDGTGLAVLLAANGQGPLYPAWSPNGTRIAYLLDPPQPGGSGEYQYQVWLMNSDGSHRTEIFRHNGCCITTLAGPAWSPDGTRIAAVTFHTLWVMNADGSEPTSLGVISGDRPAWQPVP